MCGYQERPDTAKIKKIEKIAKPFEVTLTGAESKTTSEVELSNMAEKSGDSKSNSGNTTLTVNGEAVKKDDSYVVKKTGVTSYTYDRTVMMILGDVTFGINVGQLLNAWNMTTNHWLKYYVFHK